MHKAFYAVALASAVAVAPSANAAALVAGSSIDFGGYLQANGGTNLGNATSLDFVSGPMGAASPGAAGVVSSYGSGTGSFAGLSCSNGSCGSISDIVNFSVGAQTIANFFSLSGGNNTSPVSFDLANISNINRSDDRFLTFTANGTIRFDGFDATPATFLFSSQGNRATSFSATALASAVPEPAAWAMMIVGFGVVGGSLRRRRKSAVSFA